MCVVEGLIIKNAHTHGSNKQPLIDYIIFDSAIKTEPCFDLLHFLLTEQFYFILRDRQISKLFYLLFKNKKLYNLQKEFMISK